MRLQTVSPRFSSSELFAFTRETEGPRLVNADTIRVARGVVEQLARELADARMVVECARHLSVLTSGPPRPMNKEVEAEWSNLRIALRDYYGGPIPVLDGESDP